MSKLTDQSLFEIHEVGQDAAPRHIIRVALESAADREFDYAIPDEFWPVQVGRRVEVPFGKKNKLEVGFCVEADVPQDESFAGPDKKHKLKQIARVVDKEPLIGSQLLELARWVSEYYVCPLGQVLAAMVPSAVKKAVGARTSRYVYLAVGPQDAAEAIERLRGKKQKQIADYLQQKGARNAQTALELDAVVRAVGSTKEPAKKLAEKHVIKLVEKTVLRSLPAIPKGMSITTEDVVLNEDQQKAFYHLEEKIDSGEFGVTLLHGVTDSGKTELYIRAIELILRKGRRAIVLLPEIALTAQTVQRFSARFNEVAVMHSQLTAAQRNAQWQKIKAGDADVVIGARSAIFAPVPKLGLIVVDEEHEPSYKQDTAPRYHGRDVAIKRAQLSRAHCILGSATPSLESLRNCESREHFSLVRLPKRVMNLPMPDMKLIDLRQGGYSDKGINLISEPLAARLAETLTKKEQAILLLNRRGYSNFIFCPSCKHTLHCRNCDAALTFHKARTFEPMQTVTGKRMSHGYAVCHYCLAQTLVPEKCPLCGKRMAMIGLGSQRLEEELAGKFAQARVARVDSDSMAGKDYYRVLQDFSEGRIDILAGTQILAKGLHFPNVTLVGVISADTCLYLPDFRANERTFQLISQVAGRAGRSAKKGTVFIQTFLPDQPAIQFALNADFDGFVREELKHRKACNLPPVWRLACVTLRDRSFEKLELACQAMREKVDAIVAGEHLNIAVRGPTPAPISRIQRFHRMQIVLQAPEAATLRELFNKLRVGRPIRPTVKIAIDIDPVNLL
jgi:primosomal protein N' (replication factor Y)